MQGLLNEIRCFYKKYESYLDVYRNAYERATPHLWMISDEDLPWRLVCGSAEKINCMFTEKMINSDSLLDEHVLVKNYVSARERRLRWQHTTMSLEQK